MIDNQGRPITKADFVGIALSIVEAVISIVVPVALYGDLKAGVGTASLWPLRLMLVDWALLGVMSFIAAFLSFQLCSERWLNATWFFAGAFIPLIILGAIDIGPYALISFGLAMVSSLVLAMQQKSKWLVNFGLLMLGVVINLGVVYLITRLG